MLLQNQKLLKLFQVDKQEKNQFLPKVFYLFYRTIGQVHFKSFSPYYFMLVPYEIFSNFLIINGFKSSQITSSNQKYIKMLIRLLNHLAQTWPHCAPSPINQES